MPKGRKYELGIRDRVAALEVERAELERLRHGASRDGLSLEAGRETEGQGENAAAAHRGKVAILDGASTA